MSETPPWVPTGPFDLNNVVLSSWEFIYDNGGWEEQGSGPGSTVANSTELIAWVKNFITTNNCSSLVDIGCGDMQWTAQVLKANPLVAYTGIDWVPSVCNANKTNHPTHTFLTQNFILSTFSNSNTYDMLICKDVLQHQWNAVDQIITNIGNINVEHSIFIVPTVADSILESKLVAAGYTLSTTVSSDEEKSIFIKST